MKLLFCWALQQLGSLFPPSDSLSANVLPHLWLWPGDVAHFHWNGVQRHTVLPSWLGRKIGCFLVQRSSRHYDAFPNHMSDGEETAFLHLLSNIGSPQLPWRVCELLIPLSATTSLHWVGHVHNVHADLKHAEQGRTIFAPLVHCRHHRKQLPSNSGSLMTWSRA